MIPVPYSRPRNRPPRLRLPPHRLALDETEFLRLLARTFCLTQADKRRLLVTLPALTQDKADRLMKTWTAAEHRWAREDRPSGLGNPPPPGRGGVAGIGTGA